jgi:LytS/YehU family sensor histidine kinase
MNKIIIRDNIWILGAIVFSTSIGIFVGLTIGIYAGLNNYSTLGSNALTISAIMTISSLGYLILEYVFFIRKIKKHTVDE